MPLSFFARVIILGGLLHFYVGIRLIPALPLGAGAQVFLTLWLVASLLVIPAGMRRSPHIPRLLSWIGLLEMGFFSFLLTLTFIRDLLMLVYLIAARFLPALDQALPLDTMRTGSAQTVLALAALMTLIGVYNARRRAPIVDVDVPIDGLPEALEGFTIAQLSDIHVGPTIRKSYLDPIVDAVNGLNADIVVVTGDIVDGSVKALAAHTQPLSRLRGRAGVYLCTGNHEYYAGADEWVAEFRRLGLTVLMNEHVVLEHGGAPLLLAGVTDFNASHFSPLHRSDPARAMAGAPDAASVRLLLAHQPRSCTAAEAAGFTLQISGHTHGGQFFPWNFAVRVQQPFTAGLVRAGKMWLYISRGTGYWGPPIRLAAPSEITRLRLVRG